MTAARTIPRHQRIALAMAARRGAGTADAAPEPEDIDALLDRLRRRQEALGRAALAFLYPYPAPEAP